VKRWGCLLVLTCPLWGLMALALLMTLLMSGQAPAAPAGVPGIHPVLLQAYIQAATKVTTVVPTCRGMRWSILAGVGQIESNQAAGRDVQFDGVVTPPFYGPRLDGSGVGGNHTPVYDTDDGVWDADTTYDRAIGPLQFIPSTWASMGRDGNDDGVADPHNAFDAALTTAVYLCGKGRDLTQQAQLREAIFSYNHSQVYVDDVIRWITHFDALGAQPAPGAPASGRAKTVVDAAMEQRGQPYSWGGGDFTGATRGICCSPGGQDGRTVVGFDCSGLTLYAYGQVGLPLPHSARGQAGHGTRIPHTAGLSALQPGDLVFFADVPGRDSTIHHVGIYIGGGQMINAPRPGTVVRVEPVWTDQYAGGARLL
jgi:cell wall-associated NlpC family hydrolase